MKLTPIAQGGVASANPFEGQSVSPERLARAKAIASGNEPVDTPLPDKQAERVQNTMKRIKMRTQQSTNRHQMPQPEPEVQTPEVQAAPEAAPEQTPTEETTTSEQAKADSDATKPLSPQFAALAKQKRALQLKEQELLAKEKALETQAGSSKALEEYKARIKSNALSVLMEEGVTYDQLTEQILASNQTDADLSALKAEIKALKEGLENQNKTLSERDAQTEQQALAQIRRDVDSLIAAGDEYETVREAGYAPKVVELIHQVWKQQGELLDVSEAASLVEKELLEDALKWTRIKKVQSRLSPPAPTPKPQQPVQQDRPGHKVMRTLTNRDGSSTLTMSKRERAIAAMEGRLK